MSYQWMPILGEFDMSAKRIVFKGRPGRYQSPVNHSRSNNRRPRWAFCLGLQNDHRQSSATG